MKTDIEQIHDGICHLGECPVWHVEHHKLYWTDILNPFHSFDSYHFKLVSDALRIFALHLYFFIQYTLTD